MNFGSCLKEKIDKRAKNIYYFFMKGTVKWFDNKKGFGFIRGEDGNEYFVHYSGIISNEEYKILNQNEEVEFDLMDTERGPQAINVRKTTNEK